MTGFESWEESGIDQEIRGVFLAGQVPCFLPTLAVFWFRNPWKVEIGIDPNHSPSSHLPIF